MPQCVRCYVLQDAGFLRGDFEHLLNRRRLQRHIGRLAGEQIVRRTIDFPVLAKFVQQSRRHRNDACLLAFAIADSQLHPLAVDVAVSQFHVVRHAASELGDAILPRCHCRTFKLKE